MHEILIFMIGGAVGLIMLITFFIKYKHRLRRIVVGDITIAYRIYGHGKPLILIGGYGSTMKVWGKLFLSYLTSHYRIIIFDNRGIGNSTVGTKEYTIEQCAEDAKGLLDKLNVKEAYVFGYSMGASIAQELVLRYPDEVKKLILGGANALGKAQMKPIVQRSLADLSGSDSALWRRRVKMIFPHQWLRKHSRILRLSVKFDREVMKKQVDAMEQWHGTESRLKNIKVSTLLLVGQEDIITSPSNALFMVQLISGAWLVQFEGCGHGLINQEPHKVAQVIKAFLLK